jgi:hypothetical protein
MLNTGRQYPGEEYASDSKPVDLKLPVLAAHWGYTFFCVALELKEKNTASNGGCRGSILHHIM